MAPTISAAGQGSLSAVVKPSDISASPSDDTIFGIPKWAFAVAAGGVVVLGLAYYVLSAPEDSSAKASKRKKDKSSKSKIPLGSKSNSTSTTPQKSKEIIQQKDQNKVTVEDVGEDEEMV